MRKKLGLNKKGDEKGTNQDEGEKCPKHNDPLKVYCETCQQVICRDCTITKDHNTHKFELIADCYPKHYKKIETGLQQVKDKILSVNTAICSLVSREKELMEQGKKVKEEISAYAQHLISRVKQSEKQLLQQVDLELKQKSYILNKQKEKAKKCLEQLETSETAVEVCLQEWSEVHVLMRKEKIFDELKVANALLPEKFQPIESANLEFKKNEAIDMKMGSLSCKRLKETVFKLEPHTANNRLSTATLTIQSHDGSPFSLPVSLISCRITSAHVSLPINCDINQTQPGKYIINFIQHIRGELQLVVQVGGIDISGSPFKLAVVPLPETRGRPVMTITRLSRPMGIAVCDNGDIVVVEQGLHRITVLNRSGEKLRSFGAMGTKDGYFMNPNGVAVSDDHIFVVDNHRLQKITLRNGAFVKSVGSGMAGFGELQFDHPTDIAFHRGSELLFVADSRNNRIQLFDKDLTHVDTITSKQLHCPCNVAFDNEGYLYIVEWGKRGITKFTATGSYISMIESSPGLPFQPSSTTVHKNFVYVSDCIGHRVCIYDTNGTLCHSFGKCGTGEGELQTPCNITIDKLGNLYVSDTYNNRVVVF